MKKVISCASLQKLLEPLRSKAASIGFVPTMGALHEGHLALIRRSKKENRFTVVSIFVNPTQFGPTEDFKRYPRPVARDMKLLKQEKVDCLWYPTIREMYPLGNSLFVDSNTSDANFSITERYCGQSRPGHFRGVLTICAKLLSAVRPHKVYMGAKDYQQTVIIERLIQEMLMEIKLVRVPTVREKDGLALSSRNVFLSPSERERALGISKTLRMARQMLLEKKDSLKTILQVARKRLAQIVDRVDYLEAADPVTLQPLDKIQDKILLLTACYVGKTRLIDNVIIQQRGKSYKQ